MTLSNQNIYAYNALNANMVQINESESYLCASLMHLGHRLKLGVCGVEEFAKELMAVVNSTQAFYKLDRVCLSMVYKGANCLQAISTHNSNRIGENIMGPGYYCFTSAKSSLLSTRKTNCRSYGNIQIIVDAFQGRPVQRSLSYLKDMGLVSGLAIPLGDFGGVRGLLFLNTKNSDDFSYSRESDYFIISLIALIAENFFRHHLESFDLPSPKELDILFSGLTDQFLNLDKTETIVNTLLAQSSLNKLKFEFEIQENSKSFFMDNDLLGYTIYKVLISNKALSNLNLYKAIMSFERHEDQTFLKLELPDFATELVDTLDFSSLKILPAVSFDFIDTTLNIKVELDRVEEGIDYSI